MFDYVKGSALTMAIRGPGKALEMSCKEEAAFFSGLVLACLIRFR